MSMFGEIVLCRFPFTSGTQFKVRPALILFDLSADAIICRVTSSLPSGPLDFIVQDWKAAGLLQASTIRLGHLITAEKSVFMRTLGNLTQHDSKMIRELWNRRMVL